MAMLILVVSSYWSVPELSGMDQAVLLGLFRYAIAVEFYKYGFNASEKATQFLNQREFAGRAFLAGKVAERDGRFSSTEELSIVNLTSISSVYRLFGLGECGGVSSGAVLIILNFNSLI